MVFLLKFNFNLLINPIVVLDRWKITKFYKFLFFNFHLRTKLKQKNNLKN